MYNIKWRRATAINYVCRRHKGRVNVCWGYGHVACSLHTMLLLIYTHTDGIVFVWYCVVLWSKEKITVFIITINNEWKLRCWASEKNRYYMAYRMRRARFHPPEENICRGQNENISIFLADSQHHSILWKRKCCEALRCNEFSAEP